MDFAWSPKVEQLQRELTAFMEERIYPAEETFRRQVEESGDPHLLPPVMEELKTEARTKGLWNLFLPDERFGAGLTNLEYAPLAEIMGRSLIAPEVFNCSAPDTGNMEILAAFGTPEQQETWLAPLLRGEIRSCFAMTEPDVASSDARNIRASIRRDGNEYVVNGRKWWTTGAADRRCRLAIFMGKTDPTVGTYRQQSMILVPMDAPGLTVVRSLPVLGYDDGHGHCELTFEDVRVPAENLLGDEGDGFLIAQSRLGPGRIHHCMRAIGMAERALEMMCRRTQSRVAFGGPLSDQGVIRDWIAEARLSIEQARLMVLKAAWMMDEMSPKEARVEIAAIKVLAARTATWVIDRAIQAHGGGGLCDDFPLAAMYAHARTLHIVDGPDEVHKMTVARHELNRHPLADGSAS
jgi:acyl-CoA dehydrogenase